MTIRDPFLDRSSFDNENSSLLNTRTGQWEWWLTGVHDDFYDDNCPIDRELYGDTKGHPPVAVSTCHGPDDLLLDLELAVRLRKARDETKTTVELRRYLQRLAHQS